MSIKSIGAGFDPIQQIQDIIPKPSEKAEKTSSFGDVLSSAMQEVDQLQGVADKKIEDLTLGKGGVTTHDAMIAMEKADLAFTLMNTVRSKIIRAYEEVIRTQV